MNINLKTGLILTTYPLRRSLFTILMLSCASVVSARSQSDVEPEITNPNWINRISPEHKSSLPSVFGYSIGTTVLNLAVADDCYGPSVDENDKVCLAKVSREFGDSKGALGSLAAGYVLSSAPAGTTDGRSIHLLHVASGLVTQAYLVIQSKYSVSQKTTRFPQIDSIFHIEKSEKQVEAALRSVDQAVGSSVWSAQDTQGVSRTPLSPNGCFGERRKDLLNGYLMDLLGVKCIPVKAQSF